MLIHFFLERDVSECGSDGEDSHEECEHLEEESFSDRSRDLFSDSEDEDAEQCKVHAADQSQKTAEYNSVESDIIGDGDDEEDLFGNMVIEPSQAPRNFSHSLSGEMDREFMVALMGQMRDVTSQIQRNNVDLKEEFSSIVRAELQKMFSPLNKMFQQSVSTIRTSIHKSSDKLNRKMDIVQDNVMTSFNTGYSKTVEMHQETTTKIESSVKQIGDTIEKNMDQIKKHFDLNKALLDYDSKFASLSDGINALCKEISTAKDVPQAPFFYHQQQPPQLHPQTLPENQIPNHVVPQIDVNNVVGYHQHPEAFPQVNRETRKRTFDAMNNNNNNNNTNVKPKRGQSKTCHNCKNAPGHETGIAKTCPFRVCLICLEYVEMNNKKGVALEGVRTSLPIMLSCHTCDEAIHGTVFDRKHYLI